MWRNSFRSGESGALGLSLMSTALPGRAIFRMVKMKSVKLLILMTSIRSSHIPESDKSRTPPSNRCGRSICVFMIGGRACKESRLYSGQMPARSNYKPLEAGTGSASTITSRSSKPP